VRQDTRAENGEFRQQLRALLNGFEAAYRADPNINHATIHHQFVTPLLGLLGWPLDAASYRLERRQDDEGGIPDAILAPGGTPLIALDVKRPREAAAHQIPDIEQGTAYNSRQLGVGLREKLRYVMYGGAQPRWLILVSMTHLHVFDSRTKRWILASNSLQELITRIDDLLLLKFSAVTQESSLERQARKYTAKPVDTLLDSLNQWRLVLARSVWETNQDFPKINLDIVQAAVRRMLDRLIIIQIIDDKGLIREAPGLLDRQVDLWEQDRAHPIGGVRPFRERLQSMFVEFNRRYNSTIFEPDITDELTYDDDVLAEVAAGIAGTGFATLDARIIGTAYERYAGYRLEFTDDRLQRQIDPRFRQRTGTYYTRDYVVKYLAEKTIRPLLDGKTVADIQNFRVLDKACGSGSFLLGAFDELAGFYEAEQKRLHVALIATRDPAKHEKITEQLALTENYPRRILERHLFGVDLNPEAAEFATVSLIIHALEYQKRQGGSPEALHLPLILNQNIKVGNSLVSALDTLGDEQREQWLNERRDQLSRIRALRESLHDIDDSDEKQRVIQEIRRLADAVNWGEGGLNHRLVEFFGTLDAVRNEQPFNWEVEFPEVFDTDLPASERGFDCDIGNPPYVNIRRMRDYDSAQVDYLNRSPAFQTKGIYDVYVIFLERALQLCRGSAGFIVSRKFFYQDYGEAIRKLLTEGGYLRELVDFTHLQVFEESDATTYTCLVVLGRPPGQDNIRLARITDLDDSGSQLVDLPAVGPHAVQDVRADSVPIYGFGAAPWVPVFDDERAVMERMEKNSAPLGEGGVSAHIFVGIQTSADAVYIMDYLGQEGDCCVVRARAADFRRGSDVVWSRPEREVRIEKEILKPLLSGEDVRAYAAPPLRQMLLFPYDIVQEETRAGFRSKGRLIPWNQLADRYPAAAEYLADCRLPLAGRENGKMEHEGWYGYVYPKNLAIQEGRKLAVPSLVDRVRCLLDNTGEWYLDNVDVCGVRLPGGGVSYEAAMALLNSAPFSWYAGLITPPFESKFYRVNKQFLGRLPVPAALCTKGSESNAELAELADRLQQMAQSRSALCTDFRRSVQGLARDRTFRDVTRGAGARNVRVLDQAAAALRDQAVRCVSVHRQEEWLVLRPTLRDLSTGEDREVDIYQFRVAEPTASLLQHFLPTLRPQDFSQARSLSVLEKIRRVTIPNGSIEEIQSALDAFSREKALADELDAEISAAQRLVDEICFRLYDLRPEHLAVMGFSR